MSPKASLWLFYLSGVIFIITFIVGAIFNCVVIYAYLKDKLVRKNTRNIYNVSLYCCFLLQIIIALPMPIISSFNTRWIFGELGCIYYAFIVCFLSYTVIGLLCATAIDHYMTVVKTNIRHKFKRSTPIWITFACFVHGFVIAICPVFGWSSYTLEGIKNTCSLNWSSRSNADIGYCLFLLIELWLFPLMIIAYCYGMICAEIQKRWRFGRRSIITDIRRKKIIKNSFIITMAFVVMWTPYAIISVYALVEDTENIPDILKVIPHLAAKSSVLLYPIIQVYLNTDLRKEIVKKFTCFSEVSKHSRRLEDNNQPYRPKDHISFIPRQPSCNEDDILDVTTIKNTLPTCNENIERNQNEIDIQSQNLTKNYQTLETEKSEMCYYSMRDYQPMTTSICDQLNEYTEFTEI